MFGKKKFYKEAEDERLLNDINNVHTKVTNLYAIKEHAIDISDETLQRIKIENAKHSFLYKQARIRNVSAK
ncbi:hypothetical protein RD055328_00800 [Companilactobacillus sp. RD055328]|uniref:YaaL family protein n=1 Tax=Companilactobacillus sp. RD055328 TaxID=2916634 RepID=UPI001FC86A1B|nr:YaaL family protein [Companilactobacillus sp. RD055328]GKQ42157.1 hypothetical protein RD055328_00800 [Companilactobacillus sp. RD055328]